MRAKAPQLPALIYDDGCALCRASASRIAPHLLGRAVTLPARLVRDEQLDAWQICRAELQREACFVDECGRTFKGHLALAKALQCAGGWRAGIGRLLARRFLAPLASLLYRLVARLRTLS